VTPHPPTICQISKKPPENAPAADWFDAGKRSSQQENEDDPGKAPMATRSRNGGWEKSDANVRCGDTGGTSADSTKDVIAGCTAWLVVPLFYFCAGMDRPFSPDNPLAVLLQRNPFFLLQPGIEAFPPSFQ
jgi:hypothetical protein